MLRDRERRWDRGTITPERRLERMTGKPLCVLFTGDIPDIQKELARQLEKRLFEQGYPAYYLGLNQLYSGPDININRLPDSRVETVRYLGELARLITGAGHVFITVLSHIDDFDLEQFVLLLSPYEALVIHAGENAVQGGGYDLTLDRSEDYDAQVDRILQLVEPKITRPSPSVS
jgi:bifunctional enzyme CysN/CysC